MVKKLISYDDEATGLGLPDVVEQRLGGAFATKSELEEIPTGTPNSVTSESVHRIVPVLDGDPIPPLNDGDLVIFYRIPEVIMATDFSEYQTGVAPHDWTNMWEAGTWTVVDDPAATGGKVLRLSEVSGNRRALVWEKITDEELSDQVEVVFRWRSTHPKSTFRAAFEVAGYGTAETGYVTGVNDMALSGTRYTEGTLITSNAEGGGFGSIPYGGPIIAGEWYWTRVRMVSGTMVSITQWKNGEAEPAPQHTNTNTVYQVQAGKVGIFNTWFDAGANIDIDFFGASITSSPAPVEA